MQDILNYNYEDGQTVEIEGKTLHALLTFLKQVADQNTYVGFSHAYTKSPKEIKDNDGTVLAVELTQVEYPSFSSYMNQKPTKFSNIHGAVADDFFHTFGLLHQENIKSGKAKELGTVKTEQKDDSPLKLA